LPVADAPPLNADEVTNKDLMERLDILERAIGGQLDDLKIGQAYIYQKIQPVDVEILQKIFEEIHQGRIEQGEVQRTVDSTRRVVKYILDKGVKIDDPEITKSLAEIYQSVNSSLTFEQQFELTLPVIPFLINYKLSLGAGVDLGAVWKELVARVNKHGKNR